MTEPRLTSGFEVSALRRLAEATGGSAVVARKGDDERGQILLCLTHRGAYRTFLERALQMSGEYRWERVGPAPDRADEADSFVKRRIDFDPDLWLIDLDVPDPERFIATLGASG